MRPRSAAVLACRIIALVMGIEAVIASVSLLAFAPAGLEGTGSFWAVIGTRAFIAYVLWIGAESISAAMARGTVEEGSTVPRRTANVAAVAFSVVGLILVTEAITGFAATVATQGPVFGSRDFGGLTLRGLPFGDGTRAAVIVDVVTLGLGLVLMLAAGDLARWQSRRFPEPEPPATQPEPPTIAK